MIKKFKKGQQEKALYQKLHDQMTPKQEQPGE